MDCTRDEQQPITEERVLFPGPDGQLEGVLSYREDADCSHAVLVIPPHPHFAGNLDNNVVRAVAEGCAQSGAIALRFNYRGVADSAIQLPDGVSVFDYWDEVESNENNRAPLDDAAAAAAYLATAAGCETSDLFAVGYSFGAYVGARLTMEMQLRGFIAVAMPWTRGYGMNFLAQIATPILFLNGVDDFVFDEDAAQQALELLGNLGRREVLGADHFYRGEELCLVHRILQEWDLSQPDSMELNDD